MVVNNKFSSFWPKRYQDALTKWENFRYKIKNDIKPDGVGGWKEISLFDRSGYCIEFNDNCSKCPLCPWYCVGLKATFIKLGIGLIFSVFWRFVREMQKNKHNKQKNLFLINQMIKRIKQDDPFTKK